MKKMTTKYKGKKLVKADVIIGCTLIVLLSTLSSSSTSVVSEQILSSDTGRLISIGQEQGVVVDAGGPYYTFEGPTGSVLFNVYTTGDAPYDYYWDFGDDHAGCALNEPSPYGPADPIQHGYECVDGDYDEYTFRLRVVDNTGAFGTGTAIVTVVELLPNAAISGPTYAGVGENVQFTSSVFGGVPPYHYRWDFDNNGQFDSNEQNPTHTYNEEGTYTCRLEVFDSWQWNEHGWNKAEGIAVDEVVIDIGTGSPLGANADPYGVGEITCTLDEQVEFFGSASGGKPELKYKFKWDWNGDNNYDPLLFGPYNENEIFSTTHTYHRPGDYTANLKVFNDGTTNIDSITVHVNNPLPGHLKSSEQYATSGSKLLKQDSNGDLHVIYYSNGHLWYTKKSNGGDWSPMEIVPIQVDASFDKKWFALAVDQSGTPHVVYLNYISHGSGHLKDYWFYHTWRDSNTGLWPEGGIELLHLENVNQWVDDLAFEIDSNGFAHVGFFCDIDANWYLYYTCFNLANGGWYCVFDRWDGVHFGMTVDSEGNLYYVRVLHEALLEYRYRGSNGVWGSWENIASGAGSYPQIQVTEDGTVHVAWWGSLQDDHEVYYRERSPQGEWQATEQVTRRGCGQGSNPCAATFLEALLIVDNKPCIVFEKQTGVNDIYYSEIYYSYPGESGWLGGCYRLSTTNNVDSTRFHGVAVDGGFYGMWTDGNEAPYTIVFGLFTPVPTPLPPPYVPFPPPLPVIKLEPFDPTPTVPDQT